MGQGVMRLAARGKSRKDLVTKPVYVSSQVSRLSSCTHVLLDNVQLHTGIGDEALYSSWLCVCSMVGSLLECVD